MASQVPGEVVRFDGPGQSGPEVEYRMDPQYRKPARIRLIVNVVLTGVLAAAVTAPHPQIVTAAAVVSAALAVFNGVTFFWRRRFRTRVTSRGIEARGYFNHFIAWQDVRGIEVGGYGPANASLDYSYHSSEAPAMLNPGGRAYSPLSSGSLSGRMARLATIKVVRVNGRKVLLRAPLVTGWAPDPHFGDKVRQFQALCQQYAGPGFESQRPAS
jgi:hypothetical protein